MPEFHQDYLTLLRLRPAQGPAQLVLTFAGVVGATGLNEAGLAVNINYLSPGDVGPGRLHSVVVRQVLASAQLADALTPVATPPRAGGAHFLVAHKDGDVISLETTARRFAVAYPEGNAIGHTNHYLASELKEIEFIRSASIGSSLARYTALRWFFRERGDRLDLAALMELTRDHSAYPRSICAHPSGAEPAGTRNRTVAALVQVPAEGVMHVTCGCACEAGYHAVSL
jgi:isopenicillin-N N-acyltransferase-like protein